MVITKEMYNELIADCQMSIKDLKVRKKKNYMDMGKAIIMSRVMREMSNAAEIAKYEREIQTCERNEQLIDDNISKEESVLECLVKRLSE